MFWNVASAQYEISLRKCLVVLRTLEQGFSTCGLRKDFDGPQPGIIEIK